MRARRLPTAKEHVPTSKEFATVIGDSGEEKRKLRAGEQLVEKLPNGLGRIKVVRVPYTGKTRQQRRAMARGCV